MYVFSHRSSWSAFYILSTNFGIPIQITDSSDCHCRGTAYSYQDYTWVRLPLVFFEKNDATINLNLQHAFLIRWVSFAMILLLTPSSRLTFLDPVIVLYLYLARRLSAQNWATWYVSIGFLASSFVFRLVVRI